MDRKDAALTDAYTGMTRKSTYEAQAGLEYFASERMELVIVIVLLAFMISVIDENLKLLMYVVILSSIIIVSPIFYGGLKKPYETERELSGERQKDTEPEIGAPPYGQ